MMEEEIKKALTHWQEGSYRRLRASWPHLRLLPSTQRSFGDRL